MPTATKERIRSSRFEPNGKPLSSLRLTNLDHAFLLALAHDRFLSADYIAKLTGTTYHHATDRCTNLATPPHAYIKICDQQLENRELHVTRKRQFELTPLGMEVVFNEFGVKVPPRRKISPLMYVHQIMSDHAMAQFRIGVRENPERFVLLTRDELIRHPSMPEAGKASPDYIPLGDTVETEKGRTVRHEIRFDKDIFVLRDLLHRQAYGFLGFEVGTGSETHRPKNGRHDHSYTESKFADLITILKKGIYRTHLGFPNGYLLFLERSPYRIENMMEIWRDMTTECPQFRRYALFQTMHRFTDTYWASSRLLTEPAQIIGEDGTFTTFSFV